MAIPFHIPRPDPANATGIDASNDQAAAPAGLRAWLDDRLGLSALRYPVPAHANTVWYALGGATFVGIIGLTVSGAWLAQYYNPDPTSARASVEYIQNVAPFGDVVRGIHLWTAYLVVLTAGLHMARVLVTAAYKAPRELNWLVGLALFVALLLGSVFTGTVLRWDQEAYEALAHNLAVASLLGPIGIFFARAFTSSVALLPRLYASHVSIIPLGLALLLITHVFLIKHHGISPTPAQADAGEAPGGRLPRERLTGSFPSHLRLMLGYGLALFGLAGALSLLVPQRIGPTPDPTMEVTKPPFLFYWLYAFEDWFGIPGILYSAAAIFGLLAALPFVDRSPLRRLRQRPIAALVGCGLLVVVVALSLFVAAQPPAKHLGM